jgi:replication factor A1
MGQTLKVKGYVKQGQRGIEINVGKGGGIEHIEKEVNVNIEPHKINEIKVGMNGLNVLGKVLDLGKVRTFSRKDGSSGKVANINKGDDSGKIRVTLWDAKAENPGVKVGDVVEVMNAYARENTFSNSIELQLGSGGGIAKSSAQVDYKEPLTPISDIGINASYSVAGHVSGIEDIREFDRPDGSKSKVSNIFISDNTGRIKVALWAEHADIINELEIGSEISIVDAYAKTGRNEEVELSAGSRTSIQIKRK